MRWKSWPHIFHPTSVRGNPGWTVFHLPSTPEGCRASGCQSPPPTRPTSSAQPRNPGLRLELPKPSVTCARRFAGRCKDAAGPAGRSRRRGRQGRQIARSTTDRLRDDTPASRISRCQRLGGVHRSWESMYMVLWAGEFGLPNHFDAEASSED
ncbi:hypothetical protein PVAP13_5KG561507 [Panicum virgatum]|uniref:Uncharacterized protein n=1 Tax=Panicum virgatum TaxID=38727 RepID=A0A8T0SS79_PANVG|nr:hypothetical protein PVAP13_5KG561507 [Panicum virgatum]